MAASRGPVDPDLYQHIFEPEIPPEEVDDEGIFYASSEDDWEAILGMIGDMPENGEPLSDEAARDAAQALGFDVDES